MGGSPIDIETIAIEHAKNVAGALKRAAESSVTEADFRGQAAKIFSDAADKAWIDLYQSDEYTVANGRVDSVYNRVIIEYQRLGMRPRGRAGIVIGNVQYGSLAFPVDQITGEIGQQSGLKAE